MADTRGNEVAEGEKGRRRQMPRFGPFVTIAASLLLLFGAASRVGKTPEFTALMGIDQQAQKRARVDPSLIDAMLMIGGVPVARTEIAPPSSSLPSNSPPFPPPRGDAGLDERLSGNSADALDMRASPNLSMNYLEDAAENAIDSPESETLEYETPVPARPAPVEPARKTYRVAEGDTWAKIAKRALGDANRWQEIRKLNPKATGGLMVGMELAMP